MADNHAVISRVRPLLTGDTDFFWKHIEQGVIAIQRCADCGVARHPPAPMCSHCQSLQWVETISTGRGHVHSYTVVHHPPTPPFDYPNAIALIELNEGVRIISQVVGIDPAKIHIGMEVMARCESVGDGLILPLFRPVSQDSES